MIDIPVEPFNYTSSARIKGNVYRRHKETSLGMGSCALHLYAHKNTKLKPSYISFGLRTQDAPPSDCLSRAYLNVSNVK